MTRFSILIGCLAITGCAAGSPSVDLEVERTALQVADSTYGAAAMAKDVDRIVQLYASDATVYPPGAPPASGLDGVREFASAFAATPGLTMNVRPAGLTLSAAGDMGYTTSDVELSVTGPDGNPVRERIRDVHVWRREADGTWRIVLDIWNSAPGPVPAAH